MKTQTELTTDFGIYGASLLVYNFTPHLINKTVYKLTIGRKTDESVFKGRWDFNLFKLIRDNYSDHYTACIEIYIQNKLDNEFNNSSLTFQATNTNIDYQAYTKINNQYQHI